MPTKIGQLLVDNGLIVSAQLDQALQAQVVFGGRIGTNLVELGFISTATLAAFLAQQLSIPALRPGDLDAVEKEALALVEPETAADRLVFPLAVHKRRLRLAMADPTDLATADEIAFRTGYGVDAVVAPELLVLYALERFYGVKKANRFVRVAESMREAAESFATSATARVDPHRLEHEPAKKGPYGLKEVAADLVAAERYADVLEILCRALAADLHRVAVFAIEGSVARGWCQRRCTVPSEVLRDGVQDPFRRIEIALDRSLVFRSAGRSAGPVLAPPKAAEADRVVLSLLGIGLRTPMLGLAIRAGNNVAAIALAVGERRPGVLDQLERFKILGAKVEDAIQMMQLRRRILGA